MAKFINIAGMRFGQLVATAFVSPRWLCQCDCGRSSLVRSNSLRTGHTRSCGCGKGDYRHGRARDSIYRIWVGILQRCNNPKRTEFRYYGGRGISVCERWLKFENFLLDVGERPLNHSIDRIDNAGNYEPGNVRWATRKEQMKNKSQENQRFKCRAGEVVGFLSLPI